MDADAIHMPLSFSGPGDSQPEGPPNDDIHRSAASTSRLSVCSAPERLYSVNSCSSFAKFALSIASFWSLDPNLLVPSRIRTRVSIPVLETPSLAPAALHVTPNGLNAPPSNLSIGYELESTLKDETRLTLTEDSVVAPELQTPLAFKKISTSSLLAYTRMHRASIMYDVMWAPSPRSVVERSTRSAVPPNILIQPATDPPIPAGGYLALQSYKLPWTIVVTASSYHSFSSRPSLASADSASPGARRLFVVGPPLLARSCHPTTRDGSPITILDVLYAVHTTLMVRITPEEWEALGKQGKAQRNVAAAYERRCTRMGGGWEGGMRRIDWLGQKTIMAGVDVEHIVAHGGEGKLIFAKP